jgi:hypothetical protein
MGSKLSENEAKIKVWVKEVKLTLSVHKKDVLELANKKLPSAEGSFYFLSKS